MTNLQLANIPSSAHQLLVSYHCSVGCFHCTRCSAVWIRASRAMLLIKSSVGNIPWPPCAFAPFLPLTSCMSSAISAPLPCLAVTLYWSCDWLPILSVLLPWCPRSPGSAWERLQIQALVYKVKLSLGLIDTSLVDALSPLNCVGRLARDKLNAHVQVTLHLQNRLYGIIHVRNSPLWSAYRTQLRLDTARLSGISCPACLCVRLASLNYAGSCLRCEAVQLCRMCIMDDLSFCIFCASPLDDPSASAVLRARKYIFLEHFESARL